MVQLFVFMAYLQASSCYQAVDTLHSMTVLCQKVGHAPPSESVPHAWHFLVNGGFEVFKPLVGKRIVLYQVLCKVLLNVLAYDCVLGSDDAALVHSILLEEGLCMNERESGSLPVLAHLIFVLRQLAHPCMLLGHVAAKTSVTPERFFANGARHLERLVDFLLMINCYCCWQRNSHCFDMGDGVIHN